MNALDIILANKEKELVFETRRSMKVRKGKTPVEKVSRFHALVGMVYDELTEVIEARASGELPKENQGLPYGTWKEFPYLIDHKGELYVRLTKVRAPRPTKTRYFRGAVEVTLDEIRADLLASETSPTTNDSPIFNIKLSSIELVTEV